MSTAKCSCVTRNPPTTVVQADVAVTPSRGSEDQQNKRMTLARWKRRDRGKWCRSFCYSCPGIVEKQKSSPGRILAFKRSQFEHWQDGRGRDRGKWCRSFCYSCQGIVEKQKSCPGRILAFKRSQFEHWAFSSSRNPWKKGQRLQHYSRNGNWYWRP